ncbi:hypothetical protein V1524DRAFT_466462 [Lipomyces starkeyi]
MPKGPRSGCTDDLENLSEDYVDQKAVGKKELTVKGLFVGAEDLALSVRARSLKSHNDNILNIYWVIPIIICFICLIAIRLYPSKGSKPGSLVTFFRKHIMLSATFYGIHVSPIRFFGVSWNVMPLRWQTLLMVGFVLLNVIVIFVDRSIICDSHEAWTIRSMFYASRSGIMATIMIPVSFLFGFSGTISNSPTKRNRSSLSPA